MYDLAVVIARMQPAPHREHLKMIEEALTKAKRVLVLLGSDGAAPSLRNPLSVAHREATIKLALPNQPIEVKGIRDMSYQNDLWVQRVEDLVFDHLHDHESTILMVHGGREDTKYPNDFQFDTHMYPVTQDISGTKVRQCFFEGLGYEDMIDPKVEVYLTNEVKLDPDLVIEYQAAKEYRRLWAASPFPPMFVAADNVVNWVRPKVAGYQDHVLLGVRKSQFGNGKWALPGGYVETGQTLMEAAKAELEQETNLVLEDFRDDDPWMCDAINRSERGRMITAVFFNTIVSDTEPPVVGGDDFEKAFWCPIDVIRLNERKFFSDHFHIIGKKYPEIYNV